MGATQHMPDGNRRYARWYRRANDGFREHKRRLQAAFDAEIQAFRAGQKRRKQRRDYDMDLVFIQAIRDRYQPEVDKVIAAEDRRRTRRKAMLSELAPGVEYMPTPDCWTMVKACDLGTFGSQTQPAFYAEASLLPLAAAIRRRGGVTHTRAVLTRHRGGYRDWGYTVGQVELWADCPVWMADAVDRTITVDDALRAWPRTVNAKVLMPFLSHELFERHMRGDFQEAV